MADDPFKDSLRNNKDMQYIKELEELAKQFKQTQARIKELEAELGEAKAERVNLERNTIPTAMFELGLRTVALASGATITVKSFYEARLPKDAEGQIDPVRLEKFYDWLQNNGHSGLVQSVFQVWTKDPAVIMFLTKACKVNSIPYEYQAKNIHWKTLESWYKEQVESGGEVPEELFDHYVGNKALLK